MICRQRDVVPGAGIQLSDGGKEIIIQVTGGEDLDLLTIRRGGGLDDGSLSAGDSAIQVKAKLPVHMGWLVPCLYQDLKSYPFVDNCI